MHRSLLLCCIILQACATRSRMERVFEAWPSVYTRSDLLKYALYRGCPFPGMSAAGLRVLLGPPARVSPGPDGATVWGYDPSHEPGPISIILKADTVVAIEAPPWSSWGVDVSLSGAIRHELQLRPDLPSAIPYGLVRGCPQPGTPSALIVAAYGAEWDRAVAAGPPDTLRLRRTAGREGQNDWWLFVADSLIDGGYDPGPL